MRISCAALGVVPGIDRRSAEVGDETDGNAVIFNRASHPPHKSSASSCVG